MLRIVKKTGREDYQEKGSKKEIKKGKDEGPAG